LPWVDDKLVPLQPLIVVNDCGVKFGVVVVCEYAVVIKRHDNNDTKNKDILSFL